MSNITTRHRSLQAPPPAYAELQAISNYSFLEGGSHPHELVAQAKALGLAALGLADRNSLAGLVRAHVAAKEVGLRLLVGARLEPEDAPRLLCYPTDRAAYGRLCRLLSLGQGRAVKGQCKLTLADVAAHAEGQVLIVLPPEGASFARGGASPAPRWRGDPSRPPPFCERGVGGEEGVAAGFEADLRRIQRAVPAARLYLAASNTRRGNDRACIAALAALAARTGVRLVAAGDVLYHAPHRRPLQDVLTAIRHHTTVAEAGFRLAANAERHLKSPAEMARLFRGHEAALAATGEIVEACRFSLDQLQYEYPEEPVPSGKCPQTHLEDLARAGAHRHFPDGIPERIATTLARELTLIRELGYAPYFLTVHDIVAFARSKAILCQGRGSAANSVVCSCLGITAVNPTEVDLLFERFISPERKEPPDIDVDFEHERREEVIQYIYKRYGRDRAGLAATVISYRARSAVREVGKAMGLSADTVAALAGMVWGTHADGTLPERHVREAGLDPGDPKLRLVLELTAELTGFPRHLSQHVGGFVLTRGPLVEVVPVGNAAMQDRTFIEWDKDDIAALGLLKVDVLALGMLSCIRRALDLLARHHGRSHTLASIPRDDGAVYDMLCRADSIGVFQVESRAQMNMLPRLKPRNFYDLVIEVAIVRPGPIQGDMVHPYLRRRDGIEPEIYPAPASGKGDPDELRRILSKTKGVPLFQEQAMRIAMIAAEFTDGEVNELRKAMATFRRRGTIGLLEEKMVSRMVERGYERAFAERCFNQIKGFGEYGFPESHAASFAHLVYASSWLKCHFPAAFACALLNAQPMGFYAPAQIVRDAREHGVEIREADVNHSDWDCTLEPGSSEPRPEDEDWGAKLEKRGKRGPALRLGLRQIDGLAEAEAERLMAARGGLVTSSPRTSDGESRAPFQSPHDLWHRGGLRLDTLERLAGADAFRSMGLDRRQALWEVAAIARAEPLPLFQWGATSEAGPEPRVALPRMALSEHVVCDYQTLRLSLKAHPMSFLREGFRAERVLACADLRGLRDGAWVAVAGVVLVRQRPGSAKGVVFMTIEDETGIANAVVWPKTLERYRRVIMASRLVLIRGRIQRHEDIIHVVSARLEDRTADLGLLTGAGGPAELTVPLARADEVVRPGPDPDQSGGHPRFQRQRDREGAANPTPAPARPARSAHPRNQRIIPRSRDFH